VASLTRKRLWQSLAKSHRTLLHRAFNFPEVAGSRCSRRPKFENRYAALSLSSFTPSGRVALPRVGFCFLRKREILASRLLQKFSFSPPVVKRDHCADEENHHDNRN
jgi:hypothetical protein